MAKMRSALRLQVNDFFSNGLAGKISKAGAQCRIGAEAEQRCFQSPVTDRIEKQRIVLMDHDVTDIRGVRGNDGSTELKVFEKPQRRGGFNRLTVTRGNAMVDQNPHCLKDLPTLSPMASEVAHYDTAILARQGADDVHASLGNY